MTSKLRIKPGLLKRLRELRDLPSEEHQARLMGVDRTTLRRINAGAAPSSAFMASLCSAFDLGLGEAFEIIADEPLGGSAPPHRAVVAV
ncbi:MULTISPECIES: helix-turn-helix domain-containing protein [Clavibacter]|jgi:hypothetical protein|uniref:XRE family transcriptional regulator n=2 Tax=Clavibacter TaxID=1573 RepID=A0A399NXT7_9MICO|nr:MULTISPECIES: helix-turn-helix transcriptional regulator [Clavibacter]KDP90899.1 hypothetical protein W824_09480 [Clavibacter cf. michiganensis LMG 26808]RII98985.1 XRE family transcriptional regulator [Clavibacter michiganensis]UKF24634.1 hypothetical protein KYT88_13045 [Clavibacter sp. A6099]